MLFFNKNTTIQGSFIVDLHKKVFKDNLEQSPFKIQISFHKLIENLKKIADSDVQYRAAYAKSLLEEVEKIPELSTGISDFSVIRDNSTLIGNLLSDLFPSALTHNEIKAVTIPFQNFSFNYTERFKKIINNAGTSFDPNFRDFDDKSFYVMRCCLILNKLYGQNFDLNGPLFYDIPDSNGIIKHYRVTYNADFFDIVATETAVTLSQTDIDQLIDNYDDIALWKQKFPANSYNMIGFGIVQLFDATIESAVSILKSDLLKADVEKESFNENFESIFRSIFKIADLKVGLSLYSEKEKTLLPTPYEAYDIPSYILIKNKETHIYEDCENELYSCFFDTIIADKRVFSISNVEQFSKQPESKRFADHLLEQDIKSCILAPIMKHKKLLGIVELVSAVPNALNSINANRLDLVLPFLTDTIDRYNVEFQNQIDAIVQKEYTAIHESVYWKFKREAQKYLQKSKSADDHNFREIVFNNVYPLFGEIDIKSSSEHRNESIKTDLTSQINALNAIIALLKEEKNITIYDQIEFELKNFCSEINDSLKADTEQQVQKYVEEQINPIIEAYSGSGEVKSLIDKYFSKIDGKSKMFYDERKKFDSSLSLINKRLADLLDTKQVEAQKIFPHYYERFKTDGVEHNLYIGASIDLEQKYHDIYLNNLRLWQLQTLCEMEMEQHRLKKLMPYQLEVTSLILVFSAPITIRFRMDEKRFDVDGSYNARYEVVKKRIDKALIKDSEERITETEKITIVYSQKEEKQEYLKHIKFLQHKDILEEEVEQFDVEDLQGVSGLKAIRVKVKNKT